jgi:hypothetical protein
LNLSKAAVGSDGANFLGAVYLTQLWAALQRSGRPDRPIYLVLDEVHNYAIPALADMLSEGAKFGLHVVAVTQYLNRIPSRTREALVGNVDGWFFFSLGAEDMDDAWRVSNGETHGWRPQDLVDGLRPHEAAMAVAGDLVKVATLPGPSRDAPADEQRSVMTASSRRYAQPEDSEASPWLIEQGDIVEPLRSLSRGPRTREELAEETMLSPDRVDAALTRVATDGDAVRGSVDGRYHLTARGSVHLRALESCRNEGEEHVETLTELAMFLEARGIALSVPKQVAGVLMPDGQFQWGDGIYNVEVECSTVSKAADQVVRNVKKGLSAGSRVLIVLPDRDRVPRLLRFLEGEFPDLRVWSDGVGVVWKERRGAFQAYRMPGSRVWPFLESDAAREAPIDEETPATPLRGVDTDPRLAAVRAAVRSLVLSGKSVVSKQEVLAALSLSTRKASSEQQVGRALSALGVRARRVKAKGERFRVYDLSDAEGGDIVETSMPRWDPTVGPDGEPAEFAAPVESLSRAPGPSSENPPRDPTDPTGPDD